MRRRPPTTSRLLTWLLPGVVALAMVAGAASALAQQPCGLAGEGDDPGEDGFQIDGQFLSGEYVSPGNDWAQGTGFAGVILGDGSPNPLFMPALHERDPHWAGNAVDPSTFSGHSNKNDDDISVGKKPWAWGAGNGPQKNDLTDVYAHATVYDVGGVPEVWLFLGGLTRAVDGDSHMDFEWNIAGLEQVEGTKPNKGWIYGLGPDAGRTVGIDFIISVDFVQGGDIPLVTYRLWTEISPGKFAYVEFTPDPGEVYVCTNDVDIPAPPWGAIAPNGDDTMTVVALQFVEMAVNLRALSVDPDDLCSATSTMMYKTRSSQSFVAELKDYALYRFPIVAAPDCAIAGPEPTCEGAFPVELCGAEPTGGHVWSYTWTGPEWTSPYTTYDRCVDVNQSGTYHLVVTDETNGCSSDTCDFDLSVVPPPPCDVWDQTVCEDGSATFCGPDGNYLWTWTYPDGSTASTRCITIDPVTLADGGTYTLLVEDAVHPECETQCSAYLEVLPSPVCELEPPCGPPGCNTTGNVFCGPDMGPGFTYFWELVSAPAGWRLVAPLNEQCVAYDAGEMGEATFRLTVTDGAAPRCCSGECEITFGCTESVGGRAAKPQLPIAFALFGGIPNPVYEGTSVRYAVPEESRVTLTVHNLRGQVVAVLEDGVVGAGYRERRWTAESGAQIASGVYFCRMEATGLDTGETFRQTQKIVVIR